MHQDCRQDTRLVAILLFQGDDNDMSVHCVSRAVVGLQC